MERPSRLQRINSNLFFVATKIGQQAFKASLLAENDIAAATTRVPPFLDQVRTKLKAKRSVNRELHVWSTL